MSIEYSHSALRPAAGRPEGLLISPRPSEVALTTVHTLAGPLFAGQWSPPLVPSCRRHGYSGTGSWLAVGTSSDARPTWRILFSRGVVSGAVLRAQTTLCGYYCCAQGRELAAEHFTPIDLRALVSDLNARRKAIRLPLSMEGKQSAR